MARTSTVTVNNIINDVHRIAEMTDGTVRVKNYIEYGAFSLGTVKNLFGSSTNDTFAEILAMDKTVDTVSLCEHFAHLSTQIFLLNS